MAIQSESLVSHLNGVTESRVAMGWILNDIAVNSEWIEDESRLSSFRFTNSDSQIHYELRIEHAPKRWHELSNELERLGFDSARLERELLQIGKWLIHRDARLLQAPVTDICQLALWTSSFDWLSLTGFSDDSRLENSLKTILMILNDKFVTE